VTDEELQRLAEAGLYGPSRADAAEQRALLARLLAQGLTVDDLVAANRLGNVVLAAFGHLIRPGDRLAIGEAAAAAGIPEDAVLRLWRAFGFPDPPSGEPFLVPDDVHTLAFFREMVRFVGAELALHAARAMGTAMSRVAEAEIALVRSRFEAPMHSQGESWASILLGYSAVIETFLPAALRAMDALHRAHLVDITRRYSAWALPPSEHNVLDLVVGFADLTGSTVMVRRLDLAGLDRAITRFEEATSDLIAAAGATLVKRLGDGVMFVTPRPDVACRLALDLVEAFRDDAESLPARVGLAVGHVAALRGDFYGPAVHLAARLASVAAPATVLSVPALRERLESAASGFVFHDAGRRELAGFDGAIEVCDLRRQATAT